MRGRRGAFRFILGESVEFNLIGDVTNQRKKGPGDKYTVIDDANGLNAFGITPTPLDAVADGWLTAYRRHGRFAAKAH